MPKVKKTTALAVQPTPSQKGGGFKAAEYNAVATAAELLEIRLLKTNFGVEPEFYGVQDEARLSFGREVLSCSFKPEDGTVAAIFKYHVYGKQGRSKLLKCEAEYAVIYAVPSSSPEEAARGFCRNVGAFAAYPYFRALVSQLSWGAGVNLPPLPAIASTAHIPPKKPADDALASNEQDEALE